MSSDLTLSPSAIAKFRSCQRAYAFEYNEGLFVPSSIKQQFGTNVHQQLEGWLRKGTLPADSAEGRTAAQGIQKGWLPVPDSRLLVEHRFKFRVSPGLLVGGIIDCVAPPGVAGSEVLLIDHKTTSDLRWAKKPDELRGDPQALVYAIWAMLEWRVEVVRARWIYYSASNPRNGKRKPQGVLPVEVLLSISDPAFIDVEVPRLLADLEAMKKIRLEKQGGLRFPPSPESCGLYGGCAHVGRCNLSGRDRLAAHLNRATVAGR
jgi:hypothetical protein